MNDLYDAAASPQATSDAANQWGRSDLPPQTLELARAAQRQLAVLAQQADESRGQVLRIFSAIEEHRQAGIPTTFDVAVELDDTTDRLLDLLGRIHDASDPYTAWANSCATLDEPAATVITAPDTMLVIDVGDEGTEQRFSAVTESTLATVGIDANEKITYWNDAAERLFGWSSDEAVGRPLSILVPEQSEPEFRERCDAAFAGHPEPGVSTYQHRDGTLIELLISPTVMFTASGEVVGGISTCRPVRRRTDHA